MKVYYQNKIWDAMIFLRESLFESFQKSSPSTLVKITKGNESKNVRAEELELYSVSRNLIALGKKITPWKNGRKTG